MKIGNKMELKSIAAEKSDHLDYKDFLKMYNYCTRDPYLLMTIDTRPTATLVFRKNFTELSYKKMIKSNQIKILNDKIKANNAQYKIDRLNA